MEKLQQNDMEKLQHELNVITKKKFWKMKKLEISQKTSSKVSSTLKKQILNKKKMEEEQKVANKVKRDGEKICKIITVL